jgi:DNA modification methylase
MKLLLGDCLDKLKELDDNSVDSIVTDPPYGLSFMGKKWDYDVPSQDIWEECIRVLKPGGHLLSFAGSRTYHRMAVRIEDAGFEIRDQLMWIYGSGFPKSHNIGKAVDKLQGNEREVVGVKEGKIDFSKSKKGDKSFYESAWNDKDYVDLDITKGNSPYEGWGTALKPAHEPIVMARKPLSEKTVVDNVLEWGTGGINIDESRIQHDEPVKTTTRTEKGDTWNESNSGLRNNPSNMASADPMGRFPANVIFDEEAGKILDEQTGIIKTGDIKPYKQNTKSSIYGDSGFFKDTDVRTVNFKGDSGGASRFFYSPKTSKTDRNEGLDDFEEKTENDGKGMNSNGGDVAQVVRPEGRFPANVIFDEEAGKILDEQTGILKSGFMKAGTQRIMSEGDANTYGHYDSDTTYNDTYGDSGGASRFFYSPKTSKTDRNEGLDDFEEKSRSDANKMMGKSGNFKTGSGNNRTTEFKNNHPTVKPTDLMLYLIRMVTPKGGTTLDPFMGSGSSGKAAVRGGFDFVGVEREEEYMKIAKARIQYEQDNPYNEETKTRVKINKQSNKFFSF